MLFQLAVLLIIISLFLSFLSLPFLIISVTPLQAKLSSFYSEFVSTPFFLIAYLLSAAIISYLLCCWISYMLYYRKTAWASFSHALKTALSAKSVFFLISLYCGILILINEYIWPGFDNSLVQIYINAIVAPVGFLLLFSHFALSEHSAHNHSLQSDGANASFRFSVVSAEGQSSATDLPRR